MKDNHTLPTNEGLQGNEKIETAIAALQQEATEEEVKGSGSVMSYVFGRYASAFYAALPVDEIIGIKERPRGQKKRAGT